MGRLYTPSAGGREEIHEDLEQFVYRQAGLDFGRVLGIYSHHEILPTFLDP